MLHDCADLAWLDATNRREDDNETEFVTLLRFDSMDAVKEFAGADETKPVILPGVEKLLTGMEPARHYRIAIAREL
jgi:hypothetical protein